MRGVLRLAAVGVAAAVVSGVSARGAALEAGKREAAFSGTFESVSGSGNMLQLTAELGFLLTEHDEVGPTVALYHSSVGSDSFTGGSFGAFYRRSTSQYVGAAQNSTGVALGISFFF